MQLQNIIANLPGTVYRRVLHRDGRITYPYVSPTVAKLLGFDPEEVIAPSTKLVDTVHPKDRAKWQQAIEQSARTLEPYDFEYRRITKSGETLWVRSIARPWREDNGDIVWEGITLDVTERKRTEEALLLTQFSLDHASDAAFWLDVDSRVVYASASACNMLGYSREELLALSVADIDPNVLPGDFYRALKRSKARGFSAFETCFRTKAGAIIPVEVSIHYLKYGDKEMMVCYSRDITERKRAAEKARQHETELARVLRRSTLGEMVSTLAHELNQPLTAIATFSDVCLRKYRSGKWESGELESTLEEIHAQADRAGQVMRRIRQFVQKSEPAAAPAHINDIVHEAANLVAGELRINEVELTLELEDGLPRVLVDMIEIEQVVLNLIGNSIEAMMETEAGKRQLGIRTSMAGRDAVEVTVRDAGAGLPADLADKAFEPFFTTKLGGTGMGLPISRTIVEAHGGRLWASQDAERGATFRFTLPANREDPSVLNPTPVSPR